MKKYLSMAILIFMAALLAAVKGIFLARKYLLYFLEDSAPAH